jgi:hydroxymethylpyrimidine kinase/phosphomethylpyrimidine kinase
MKTSLTIAGSDCSGGAGIQADLKTFAAFGIYGMSAITAITSQNTIGVHQVYPLPSSVVSSQLESVFSDIFPDSVKIGMCVNSEIVESIASALKKYHPAHVITDTVMLSSSGKVLLDNDAIIKLSQNIFPLSELITPNIPEAQVFSGVHITSENDMVTAAKIIFEKYGTCVLLKGGHLNGSDLFYNNGKTIWYHGSKIENPNTHGTGCTLSSAIAANLAVGMSLENSIKSAKEYITGAIKNMMDLGKGRGPLNHLWRFT